MEYNNALKEMSSISPQLDATVVDTPTQQVVLPFPVQVISPDAAFLGFKVKISDLKQKVDYWEDQQYSVSDTAFQEPRHRLISD